MTQEERWQANYNEVKAFIETNHRNLSKYELEERRLYTWVKHNRKQMNAGVLKEDRIEQFNKLLKMCEQYRRKNQYE
jgi:hypothetical protein